MLENLEEMSKHIAKKRTHLRSEFENLMEKLNELSLETCDIRLKFETRASIDQGEYEEDIFLILDLKNNTYPLFYFKYFNYGYERLMDMEIDDLDIPQIRILSKDIPEAIKYFEKRLNEIEQRDDQATKNVEVMKKILRGI